MEFAKDEIFNIRYNSLTGTIECGTNHKRKIRRFLKQNRIVVFLSAMAVGLTTTNAILIMKFINNFIMLKVGG